jgi:hypothetical protein
MDDQPVQRSNRRGRRFTKHPRITFGIGHFRETAVRGQARGRQQNAMVEDRPMPGGPIEFIQPRPHARGARRLGFPSLHAKRADFLEEILVQV